MKTPPSTFVLYSSAILRLHRRTFAMGSTPSPTYRHIAVIGAGAAGLVAARELRKMVHTVVVFEQALTIGGTWTYTLGTECDQLGTDPDRQIVHTSMYESLRTNLPRECMGFLDYPFVGGEDQRRFPGHKEVIRYLEGFGREFGISGEEGVVRFGRKVVSVEKGDEGKWVVRSRDIHSEGEDDVEVYDGVVVCSGHHTEPRIADIPGIDAWPGQQIHSHNYRVPEPFTDQVVILIGSSASALDISRDIASFAKEVHVASRSENPSETPRKQPGYNNMWIHAMIKRANENGSIDFQDGSSLHADVIMHCTGYKYHFPFLQTKGIVQVDDNRVGPLYKHVFPPSLAPGLSFIGLPWKVIPFPLFELQSKWVAAVLSGQVTLPTVEEMMQDIEDFYNELEAIGYPKRYTHNLSGYQFEYDDWLAAQCGYPATEEWRNGMYKETSKNRAARPESYRDVWDDKHLVEQAQEDFRKLLESKGEA